MQKELPFYVALAAVPGIGPIKFKLLMDHFKSAEKIWKSNEKVLKKTLPENVFKSFLAFRKSFDPQNYLNILSAKNIRILTIEDKNYPKLLKEIADAPPALYLKGEFPFVEKVLGVVGTRKITGYGKQVTEILVRDLVAAGFVIVSGLARGVDALAHQVTLENGGQTVAVLGGGVDKIYPPENEKLAKKIIEKGGAVISEYPLGMQPVPGNFPARNRIISGLSLGILVTEAGEDSGSLITAGLAGEQGREVFAVPGPIYSKLSKGPSALIKQGAKLVGGVEDILEEFSLSAVNNEKSREIRGDSKEEQAILDILKEGPAHIDEIARKTSIVAAKLGSIISIMELKGKVKALSPGTYSIDY